MFKKGDRPPLRGILAVLALLLLPALAGAATASSRQLTGVEMTNPVRQTLKQLGEKWLEWVVQNGHTV